MTALLRQGGSPAPASPLDGDSLQWDNFLGRSTPPSIESESRRHHGALAGKRILVTGAGGCIGSALAQAIAHAGAREIVLLDTSESALYQLSESLLEIDAPVEHTAVLASICDTTAIADVFRRHSPEIVFHAAALKHVPLMETNPFAVVANNALGTHILASAAEKHGCRQMMMVSTDKAADPISLMGASKRIAELAMLTPRSGVMRRSAVRLGNVLGSSGSVVPLFLRQIAHGGPLTVTDPRVRRYFMTLTEAVDALLRAVSPGCPGGLLAPDPALVGLPIRVLDLANYLVAASLRPEVPIVFTALRPGDKMEETLISTREAWAENRQGLLQTIITPMPDPDALDADTSRLRQAVERRDLQLLLDAVLRLVPEYQPSQLLREQLPATAAVSA